MKKITNEDLYSEEYSQKVNQFFTELYGHSPKDIQPTSACSNVKLTYGKKTHE